jgi:gamma-glutamylputrescine oxidase
MSSVASYYDVTANARPEYPVLSGAHDADVCVVGGGIAGCSTALHLAERGYRVILLEAERIAWGASGRSGGQAIFGYACGQAKLETLLGLDDAKRLWDISTEALDLIKTRIERHRIECDAQWGQVHVAVKNRQRADLAHEYEELTRKYRYSSVRLLETSEVEGLLATRRYCGGLFDSRGGHLHPLNYTLGLARAAQAAGVRIFERSRVHHLRHGPPAVVETATGTVSAAFVVLCGNAYLTDVNHETRSRIMPVGTYIVATEVLGQARVEELIRRNYAITDSNFVLDYFRRSADHRLLFGGRVSYSGRDLRNTANATRARMLKVFPQLAGTRIEYAWGGYVDITMNRAPDFGRIAPHIYYLQGFSGHGIALAGMAGKVAAEAIAGQTERLDLFARIPHRDFPGGPALRTPLLMLAMLWYRMRDWL